MSELQRTTQRLPALARAELIARTKHLPPYRITARGFDRLLEYSATLPTGQTPGKLWKARDGYGRWVIGQYDPHYDGKAPVILIHWLRPVIICPAQP